MDERGGNERFRQRSTAQKPGELADGFPQRQQKQAAVLNRVRGGGGAVMSRDLSPRLQRLRGSSLAELLDDQRADRSTMSRGCSRPFSVRGGCFIEDCR